MWKKPRQNSWCDNSNNNFSTTASNDSFQRQLPQLGASLRVLYRYTEFVPNKITNHDKQENYLTNTIAKEKIKFAVTVGSNLRTLIKKHC